MAGPVPYHIGKFPPENLDWQQLIPLLGPASAALAGYNGLLSAIPNAAVLLSPVTTQEAVLSSRIEGTQATIGEVLEYEAGGATDMMDPDKEADIQEVLNYRQAMRQATETLQTLPLCNRLIKTIHETLLSGMRGHDKRRGRFRTIQNYIGPLGRPVEEMRFVPIAPESLEDGMARWERFIQEPFPDLLVQLAVVHAEFESLHPFLDGNGRIGRIIIPLYLFVRENLDEPMFYLSECLEENREEYVDRLLAISRDDDWTGWCRFFLKVLIQQAERNKRKARRILELYDERKGWIIKGTRSQYAVPALDFLFSTPIFQSTRFIEHSQIPAATARRILNFLSDSELILPLREASGRRAAIYAFSELLRITEGRTLF